MVKWNAHLYSSGVHTLEVNVVDDEGKQRSVKLPVSFSRHLIELFFCLQLTQSFSLDGTRNQFDTMARLTLMSDATTIFKIFFGFAVSFCVVPLVFFRLWHTLIQGNEICTQF